ncbi:NYN domain-containing protein [Aerosakkonemataceae cyanobacterium BLCC-F50]|uniref:NYN domain-containing protein n=1 Tax=Floridaenema flaviceps BLCC-F50 TaxID=3153642 RepID=A0ABV4XMS4_9CYAN
MKCPQCQSTSYRKNGRRNGRQNYLCKNCGRQFLETANFVLSTTEIYAPEVATVLESESITEVTPVSESNEPENLPSDMQMDEEIISHAESVVSVLLLDAENLKIDQNAEKFLLSLARSPQLIKIAFANWRNASLAKQDADLYDRGYQLIHVPNGKNSADAKMIAFGASIFKPYPLVKEVFICSSDGLLMHLCHQLQNHGIVVYWVRRKEEKLIVENRHTGKTKHYSISLETEIPPLDMLMSQLESLLQLERESIDERISKISAFSALFQARCNIVKQENSVIEKLDATPTKSDNSNNLQPEVILNPSQINNNFNNSLNGVQNGAANKGNNLESIDSKEKLEKALIQLMKKIKSQNPEEDISLNVLAKEFMTIYGKPPRSVIKELGLSGTLSKFLKSCNCFNVKQKGNKFKIELT